MAIKFTQNENKLEVLDNTGIISGGTPTASDHLTTKSYVDGRTTVTSGQIAFGTTGNIPIGTTTFLRNATTGAISIGTTGSMAMVDVLNTLNTRPVLKIAGATGQSADYLQVLNNAGTVLSAVKSNGSYQPASLTNASAINNSLYYSTTLSRLAYKDSSGNVFAQNQRQFSTKTVNYTLTIADDYVRFDGTSLTATLPNATTMPGHEFEIKNVNSTVLTINTTSSQLMDSNLTVSLIQYEVLKVVSNGTNWDII